MARRKENLATRSIGPSDELALGLLETIIPRTVIRRALSETGRQSLRHRLLPNDFIVYFVVAAYLYMGVSQSEVLRLLLERLVWLFRLPCDVADKGAISKARQRVGSQPLQKVFADVARPLATPETKGAFYNGYRLCAIDGSTMDIADSQKNRDRFGKSGGNGPGAPYPQMRIAALCEIGTRALFDANCGKMTDSELTLAGQLLRSLDPDMLLIGDRLYGNFPFAFRVERRSAKFLFRVRSNVKLAIRSILPDGSALADWRYKKDPRCKYDDVPDKSMMSVRLINYRLTDDEGKVTEVKLITDLLDETSCPAKELVSLYADRWAVETAFDELKTRLKGSRNLLRSGLPDLVVQDFFGLLLAHFLIRHTMHEAAVKNDVDPRRLSFSHARNTLKRRLIPLAVSP